MICDGVLRIVLRFLLRYAAPYWGWYIGGIVALFATNAMSVPPGATSGVMLFVYLGQSPSKRVCASAEGALRWYPLEALPLAEMVDDLPLLLPRVLGEIGQGHLVYGNYVPDRAGELTFHFSE